MTRIPSFAVLAVGLAAAVVPSRGRAQCDAPSLLVILDKSSSMITGSVPSGITKWEAASTAVGSITSRFEDAIDFGLLVFPNPEHCEVSGVAVDVGPWTAADIASYLVDPPPTAGNYTPMASALDVAAAYAPLSDPTRRRVAVLVTDGWQWCYPYDPATRFDPVAHAEALRATGTTLYVVGFGDGVDALTLNRLAVDSGTAIPGCDPAGDTPTTPNPCYERAEDTASLEAVLEAIARHTSEEICDGIDSDCDGLTDEDLARPCSTACGTGSETCDMGTWVGCDAPQPAAESCDGADNDCDGAVDEECDCIDGEERPCGADAGACVSGLQSCIEGAWSACEGEVRPVAEVCDNADNDCDGTTDEGCVCRDGETRTCGTDVGACAAGAARCVAGAWTACEGAVEPRAESCDGVDEDCNGAIDDGAACPPGRACREGVCVEENPVDDPPIEPLPDETDVGAGCGCSVAGAPGLPGLLGLLFALFAVRVGRRR
jgi:MYXO-CTERM domain-containing protein